MAKRRNPTRKKRPRRQLALRVLVVTEGKETEKQYVERLNASLRSKEINTTVKAFGTGKDPRRVVMKCLEHRDRAEGKGTPYDHCVCVVDVDQHSHLEDAAALARSEGLLFLVSNVKFENWLLWHRVDSLAPHSSQNLDSLMKKHGLVEGKKLPTDFPFANVGDACSRARRADPELASSRIGPNPSSAMPLLVDLLRGTSPAALTQCHGSLD